MSKMFRRVIKVECVIKNNKQICKVHHGDGRLITNVSVSRIYRFDSLGRVKKYIDRQRKHKFVFKYPVTCRVKRTSEGGKRFVDLVCGTK